MNTNLVRGQYSTGLSRGNIEQALVAAGKDVDHLQPADLALLEDFHTMGRIATSQLVDLIGITSDNEYSTQAVASAELHASSRIDSAVT